MAEDIRVGVDYDTGTIEAGTSDIELDVSEISACNAPTETESSPSSSPALEQHTIQTILNSFSGFQSSLMQSQWAVINGFLQQVSSSPSGNYINYNLSDISNINTNSVKLTAKERKKIEADTRKRERLWRREEKKAAKHREEQKRIDKTREERLHKINVANNSPDRRSTVLRYPIGFEYTFMLKNHNDKALGRVCNKVKDEIKYVTTMCGKSEELGLTSMYSDGVVVEIGSPPHKTWKEMEWWYDLIIDITQKYGLIPWKVKKGGGGAHANISMPMNEEFRKEFMINLCTDIVNRPYINWVFNDPSDNHTANCPLYNLLSHRGNRSIFALPPETHVGLLSMADLRNVFSSKSYALRFKSKNGMNDSMFYELRTFDMPRNKRDLRDIVNFLSAYLMYIDGMTERGITIRLNPALLDLSLKLKKEPFVNVNLSFIAKTAERDFMHLIDTIGLERKDYSRFMERNLRRRIKKPYGENYML